MEKIIRKILEKLENNGYKAYIVGGYVRDTLRGITSYDVDICTNALPKDIHNLFNVNSINNYGGANLKIGKYNLDITTFREEISYIGRRPNELKYIDSLEKDLIRRDFTINAICMDKSEKIIDLLNGIDDLNNSLIRCIGDCEQKLKEDPLRILRAIRFATILDFTIEDSLQEAIKRNVQEINKLSKERIKEEYNKILLSKNFKKGLNLLDKFGINKLLNISYDSLIYTTSILGMWAQIKFNDMPFTKQEKSTIIKIAEILKNGEINNSVLYKYGLYLSTVAGEILGVNPKVINKAYKKLPIKERKDIALSFTDLLQILEIKPGKIVNQIYQELESALLNNTLKNNNKEIKKYLLDNKGKW